jgi:hypothetical protein
MKQKQHCLRSKSSKVLRQVGKIQTAFGILDEQTTQQYLLQPLDCFDGIFFENTFPHCSQGNSDGEGIERMLQN